MDFAKSCIPLLGALNGTWPSHFHGDLELHLHALKDVELCIRQHMNIVAPINRLPDELLARIFVFVCSSDERAGTRGTLAPFNLLRVSRCWHSVASSFATVWSRPRLSLGRDALAVMIARSRAAPLHITWDEGDCASHTHLDRGHSAHILSRAESISLSGEPQHIAELLKCFLHPAPALSYLRINHFRRLRSYDAHWPEDLFCGNHPQLVSLELEDVAVPLWRSPLFCETLRTIRVSSSTRGAWVYRLSSADYEGASYGSFLNALRRAWRLEHLHLKDCVSFALSVARPGEDRPHRSINVSHLRTLLLDDTFASCASVLSQLKLPPDCVSRVRCPWAPELPANPLPAITAIAGALPRDSPAVSLTVHRHVVSGLLASHTDIVFSLHDAQRRLIFQLRLACVPQDAGTHQAIVCAVGGALPLTHLRALRVDTLAPLDARAWRTAFGTAHELRSIAMADLQVYELARVLRDRTGSPHPHLCAVRCTDLLSTRSLLALRRAEGRLRSRGGLAVFTRKTTKDGQVTMTIVRASGRKRQLY
ncbi:hypothetical protein K488DRAFT_71248 [Vararia minispora EC-137]|uniref:Uncharacterized protein n=1 Tax=Vararia minispora EC-137 TaxID=1314806 RepID=A0ACB8QII2_9AGAM|nr:hypothetical protein K488DRAFT_71248 [Vararia minispora EC-137]